MSNFLVFYQLIKDMCPKCVEFIYTYQLCGFIENTETWLADTGNKLTFMFA